MSVQLSMFDQQNWQSTPNVTSLPVSGSGRTPSDAQDGEMTAPSGPDLAHANLSARQAKEMGLMTSGTYGHTSIGSSASAVLQSSLESRLRVKTQTLGSTLYNLTWKPWVTPSGQRRSRLRASVRRTSATDCIGWPTPKASGDDNNLEQFLVRQARAKEKWPNKGMGMPLGPTAQLAGWPTATTTDSVRSPSQNFETPNITLNHAAVMSGWRTPTAGSPNSLRGNGQDPAKRLAGGHTVNLTDEVNWLKDNPSPARLTVSGEMLIGSTAGMESGGQLNPAHSRWLMGLPPEWDDCAVMAMQSMQKQPRSSSLPTSTPQHDNDNNMNQKRAA